MLPFNWVFEKAYNCQCFHYVEMLKVMLASSLEVLLKTLLKYRDVDPFLLT